MIRTMRILVQIRAYVLTLDPRKIIRLIFSTGVVSTKISGKQGGRQDAAEVIAFA